MKDSKRHRECVDSSLSWEPVSVSGSLFPLRGWGQGPAVTPTKYSRGFAYSYLRSSGIAWKNNGKTMVAWRIY